VTNSGTVLAIQTLSFLAIDMYDNRMFDDAICSYYAHKRFVLVFSFMYKDLSPKNTLTVSVMNETFGA